jgi:4-hydroxybenzoate polyprenyltransferase
MTDLTRRPEPTWKAVVRLLRWDKPEGRLILMIPALWAVFLAAKGYPPLPLVGVIILGAIATSAAGCVVNDLWDRDIDPQVQRTRDRPLASRALTVRVGWLTAIIAFLSAWGLALYLNPVSFLLCLAAVPVIVFYPLAKRIFPVPQLILALAWGFAVLISWSAVTCADPRQPCLSLPTWLLWEATVLWTLGFDTVYAMADREDDRRLGINSSALFLGDFAAEGIGLFYAGTAFALFGLGWVMGLNWLYWITWILACWGWWRQFQILRRPHLSPAYYGQLFKQNVWIGMMLLFGMILGVRW